MIPKELFKKIRHIEITTNRLVTDVFAGQYHSVFKGRGIEFDEVREYQIGDDIRSIDWNVTARTGRAHVKKYVEEREMTVMLLVDASASCRFASVQQLKSKLAAELAAILAFSAIRNNDKVGLIVFTDKIEKFIAPRRGKKNVLRLVREVLYFKPQNRATDISVALDYLNRVMTRKAVTFLISDFFNSTNDKGEGQARLKRAMTVANKRHDLVAVTLNDPRECDLTVPALLTVEDAETGQMRVVDSSDDCIRAAYRAQAQRKLVERNRFFSSIGVDHVDIATDKPYVQELVKFFLRRRKQRV